ncbi:hypothetical protein [Sinorhizobium psoraleae]|uniref:Uncharacterized protein n=1 Tax=Sinorhizobium psoraleae TaxID=520838 RepID=A0ABT4KAU3_9HYPH|nr:hypothetical protein [Sinorhizobium psoraleae]MCZ4089095.1 hypothetical protein [Sinorhizobium psoraleae]
MSIFTPSEFTIKFGLWGQLRDLHERMAAPFKDLFYVGATRISRKGDPRSCFAEYRLVGDDATSARGIHAVNNFVFVDDADGVPEEVIATLQNIMSDPNPKLCLLSTKFANETPAKPVTITADEYRDDAMRALRSIVNNDNGHHIAVRFEAAKYLLQYADQKIRSRTLN